MLNTFILTKVKVQSTNYVYLPARASNKLRGDVIMLGDEYVCDAIHDKILETVFLREELHYYELILEGSVESIDDDSECNEK